MYQLALGTGQQQIAEYQGAARSQGSLTLARKTMQTQTKNI